MLGLAYMERDLHMVVGGCNEAADTVVPRDSDQPSDNWEGSLIAFPTDHVKPLEQLSDDYFQLDFPNAVSASRHTEYCQWAETKHTNRVVVGQREVRDSEGNRKTEDIVETQHSFTYHLAWRSHRINSMFFDNP